MVGALVRRDCRSVVLAGFASHRVGVLSDRCGNFSDTVPDPAVPASKMHISDGIVAAKAGQAVLNVQVIHVQVSENKAMYRQRGHIRTGGISRERQVSQNAERRCWLCWLLSD